MEAKMEQFPANNPNPVLSAGKDGIVLYSNMAGEPLLHEWGISIGEKLPSHIENIIKKVISLKSSEKMEINVGNKVYLVSFHPLPEDKCVNIYGFDISEQKELEQKLRESEARFRLALKNAPVSVAAQDRDLRYIWAYNQRTARPEEIMGHFDDEIFTPKEVAHITAIKRRVLDEGIELHEQTWFNRPSGRTFLDVFWEPIRDAEGQITGVASATIDLTSIKLTEEKLHEAYENLQRQSEELQAQSEEIQVQNKESQTQTEELHEAYEALRKSEDQFRILVKNLKSGVALVDETGRFAVVNPSFMQMFGLDNEIDILNVNSQNWSQWEVYGENGKLLHVDDHPVRKVVMTGKPVKDQLVAVRNPGASELTWMLISAVPILKEDGHIYRIVCTYHDITQRKKAEEALKKSEEKYRSLYEKMLDGFVLVGMDGFIREYNNAYREMLGYSDTELRYLTYSDITPKKWHAFEAHIVEEEIVKKGYSGIYEKEYRRKDGTIIPIELRTYLIRDASGQPAGMWGIVRDITERKQLEEKIRQRAEELEMVMEVAPVAIWVGHDPQSHNITGNKMANEFYEAEVGENVSANVTPVRRFFHKGRELTADELPMQEASLKDIDVRSVELDVLLPSGEYRAMLGSASALHDTEGHVRGSVGAFVDITSRKKAEAKLKETLDNLEELVKERTTELEKAFNSLKESERGLAEAQRISHIGNWDWNIITDKIYLSDEVYRIYGYDPQEFDITYDLFLRYLHPDDRDRVDEAYNKASKEDPISIDYRIILDNGEERAIHAQGEVIYNEENIRVRTRGTFQDITERKKAEETLKLKMEELRRSNEELEQFAYVSSHDLQEPLRMISSYLQLLQRRYQGKIDDKADKYIFFAVDGAARMQNLINDLLEFSRIATRAKEPEPTDSEFVLSQALSNLELYIKQNKATVTRDPLPEVMADSSQLGQIFQNLIINGIKFHSEEAPKIHISAERKEKEWLFSVKDNGIGIDPQYSEKIFEVFKRLHTKGEYPGTGIGLAICKKIIERHGGCIWVESELCKGSAFYFTLPVNAGEVSKT